MEVTTAVAAEVREFATQALRETIPNAFLTMAGLEAATGEEHPHRPESSEGRSVAGVIGWVGRWNGTGIFECSPEFAAQLSNCMLGREGDALSEDALDAVAEMTNIIFGGMKTELEDRVGPMGLSTPTVVVGNDVGVRGFRETFTVLPILIGDHILSVKLYIACKDDRKKPSSALKAGAVSVGI